MVRWPLCRAPGAALVLGLIGGAASVVGCGDVSLVSGPGNAGESGASIAAGAAGQAGGVGPPACMAGGDCCEMDADCKMGRMPTCGLVAPDCQEARLCPCRTPCKDDDKKGKCQLLTGGGPGPD